MEVEKLIGDKKQLEKDIKTLLTAFEEMHGDLIHGISYKRWNGSNHAFGQISNVSIILLIE